MSASKGGWQNVLLAAGVGFTSPLSFVSQLGLRLESLTALDQHSPDCQFMVWPANETFEDTYVLAQV